MIPCPACGEQFDPEAHQLADGEARCPSCSHVFVPDLNEAEERE